MIGRTRAARLALLVSLFCVAPVLMGVERPPGLGDVQEVRTWSYEDYTRVVVELTKEISVEPGSEVRLAANARAGRPERLYVDLPGIWVGRRYDAGIEVGDGLLDGVRLGQNTLRNTRLVIDLERYERHRIFTLPSPARIVVDVYGERSAARDDSNGRLPTELRRVHTIVVDPGHGGRDPGATGIGGLREKDVNLAIAKKLEKSLEARGFKVVLTRRGDSALSLEERTAIAESSGGDVFVSIHANAARRARARGIEIYTLDASHERHSLDVAARENRVPAARLDPLQRALARIQAGEIASHSERLAGLMQESVMRGAKQKDASLPDLGVKKGPFYVLFMSSMASVLVETGFVTNKRDARLLANAQYQALLADQIAEGVDRYRLQMEAGSSESSRIASGGLGLSGRPTRIGANR